MRRWDLLALSLAILLPSVCRSANSVYQFPISDFHEQLLNNPHFDIIVVRVVEIEEGHDTHGNPPRVSIEVMEVIRGDLRTKVLPAHFEAPPIPPEHYGKRIGRYEVLPTAEWAGIQFTPPAIGQKLIVFTQQMRSDFRGPVQVIGAYEFSDENKNTVLRNMAPPERSGRIQFPLFLAMLALPVVALVLFGICWAVSLPFAVRALLRGLALLLCVAVFPIYLYYESGVSIHTNIRVDLLLLYPALLINIAVLVAGIVSVFMKRRKRTSEQPVPYSEPASRSPQR